MATLDIERQFRAKIMGRPAIVSLIGARMFPVMAAQGAAYPYGVYTLISFDPSNVLSGALPTFNAIIQLDLWDNGYATCKDLANEMKIWCSGTSYSNSDTPSISMSHLVSERDATQVSRIGRERPAHRISQDYSLWGAPGA